MEVKEIENLIKAAIPDAIVKVQTEDGRHYQAVVISESFKGMARVRQHQMVYAALGEKLGSDELHAFALTTKTEE